MSDQTTPSPMTVLRGGENFTVTKEDGTTEEVRVRIVPISQLDEYLVRYESIAHLCVFVVDRKIEWFDELTEESAYALNRKVRELNDPRFDRWVSEKAATVGSKLKDLLRRLNPA